MKKTCYSKYKRRGWFNESYRHSLARKGVKTRTEMYELGQQYAKKQVSNGEKGSLLGTYVELLSPNVGIDFSKRTKINLAKPITQKNPKFILNLSKKLSDELKKQSTRLDVVGSIRRKEKNINDIDIVLIPKDREKIISVLEKYGSRIEGGDKKLKYNIKGVSTEVYFATPNDYGAMLLTYTGPSGSNIGLRTKAKNQGYLLSQYGLFDRNTGKLLASKTEEDILKVLKHPYKKPEER